MRFYVKKPILRIIINLQFVLLIFPSFENERMPFQAMKFQAFKHCLPMLLNFCLFLFFFIYAFLFLFFCSLFYFCFYCVLPNYSHSTICLAPTVASDYYCGNGSGFCLSRRSACMRDNK